MSAYGEVSRPAFSRPAFLQFMNPEILRLYGVNAHFTIRSVRLAAARLTRTALFATDAELAMPASYLFEVPFIREWLRTFAAARDAGTIAFISPTSDVEVFAVRKAPQYRDDLTLFSGYAEKGGLTLARGLIWVPRSQESASGAIAGAWRTELGAQGLWERLIARQDAVASLEDIASVPDRLDGRAFIPRFAFPLLPFAPDMSASSDIAMMLSRVYLESYLREINGWVFGSTPIGDLTCGLATYDGVFRRVVPWRTMSYWLRGLRIGNHVERSLTVPSVLRLRGDPRVRHLMGVVEEQLDGEMTGSERDLLLTRVARRCDRLPWKPLDAVGKVLDAFVDEEERIERRGGASVDPYDRAAFASARRDLRRYGQLVLDLPERRMPTVFISWAHRHRDWDDGHTLAWEATVFSFVCLLRAHGIEADIDLQHISDVDVDWTRFGPKAIEDSDIVLLAVSRAYRERWDGRNLATEGSGAAREADALKGMFDRNQSMFQRKARIVILPGASEGDVPAELSRLPRYVVSSLGDLRALRDLVESLLNIQLYPAFPTTAQSRPSAGLDPLQVDIARAAIDHARNVFVHRYGVDKGQAAIDVLDLTERALSSSP